jgi:hypothetical protein
MFLNKYTVVMDLCYAGMTIDSFDSIKIKISSK